VALVPSRSRQFEDGRFAAEEADVSTLVILQRETFEVTEVVLGAWPDGRERYTIRGVLTTAGMSKTDLTLSPPESAATIKEEPDEKRRMGMLINARNVKRLEEAGFTLEGIKEGDTIHVRTGRVKPREGYVSA
jgi:hypothetical protein